jgi:hypothetical protein
MQGAAEEWHDQLLVTVARVKAFFGYSKDMQDKPIKLDEPPTRCAYGGDV